MTNEQKPKKEKKKKAGYFDNAIMLELMKERNALEISLAIQHDTLEETRLRRIEEKIGALYIEVAHGMLRRPNFINYPQDQKDDMISDALFCMTKAGAKYDTNYPNPFGYLSQITFHAFIQSIKNMKKRTGLFVSIEHIENLNETGDYSE